MTIVVSTPGAAVRVRADAVDVSAGAPLLRARDVDLARCGGAELRGVSLEVGVGEIVGIFGAAGAGKSALLEALAGVRRVDAGSIVFRGREITSGPAHQVAALGLRYVPQVPVVFPGLTVRDHVALAAAGRWLVDAPRRRRDDVERALEAFPVLRERAAQPAVRLSEPERSALALAQAAAGCPRLILIDDPASRLPPVLADAALAFLGGLRDGGVSVLVADPPPYRALAFADRGYTLDGGTLAASGAGSALRRILGGADP